MNPDEELVQRISDLLEQQRRPTAVVWASVLFAVAGAGLGGTGYVSTQNYYTRESGERLESEVRREVSSLGTAFRREIDAANQKTKTHVDNHPDVALDERLRHVEQAIARIEAQR